MEFSDLSVVNYCNEPTTVGHLVIQPLRHVEKLTDLQADETADLIRLIWKYNKALQIALDLKPKKIYLCQFGESPD